MTVNKNQEKNNTNLSSSALSPVSRTRNKVDSKLFLLIKKTGL